MVLEKEGTMEKLEYPFIFMWILQDPSRKGFELQGTEKSGMRLGHARNRREYFGVDWSQFEHISLLFIQMCVDLDLRESQETLKNGTDNLYQRRKSDGRCYRVAERHSRRNWLYSKQKLGLKIDGTRISPREGIDKQ